MSVNFFISYAHEDKNKALALSNAISKSQGSFQPILVDKQRSPGKPLTEKIRDCINKSLCIIPIFTKNSIRNQWVNQEVGYSEALNKKIYPIVEKSIMSDLKGFIHDQMDLPFSFKSHKSNPKKEAASFRRCYKDMISYILDYIVEYSEYSLISEINPELIKQGDPYETRVSFKGKVKNGFFDNYVKHLDSKWFTWNWDKGTLRNARNTTPGNLHGNIEIERKYIFPTTDWPKGKYKIYVSLYDHLVPGEIGRVKVAENVHDIEVV